MGSVAVFASGCPHYEQRHIVYDPDALIAPLAVGMTLVLSGEQIAVEKPFEIRKADAVILQVDAALPLVPGIHAINVYAKRICFK
jgi:hypothetical protein